MKNVIVTVDTEGHEGNDPVKHLIWGITKNNSPCGISLIMDECDKVGAKALFFVDLAEAWHFGEEKISEVMKYIVNRGHEVGVHIHPDHMADPNRMFLYEYSYEEQFDIIKKCTDFYEKVLGVKPVAFRAGKYAANRDTLSILALLGYKADFSQFYGQKWCGLIPPVTQNTTIKLENGLVEVPVVSYESQIKPFIHRFDKLDINTTRVEHKYLLKRIEKQDTIQTVTVFVHSFSFLYWRQNINAPRFNHYALTSFVKALNQIKDSKEMKFSNIEDIYDQESLPQLSDENCFKVKGLPALYFFTTKAIKVLSFRIWARIYGKTL